MDGLARRNVTESTVKRCSTPIWRCWGESRYEFGCKNPSLREYAQTPASEVPRRPGSSDAYRCGYALDDVGTAPSTCYVPGSSRFSLTTEHNSSSHWGSNSYNSGRRS